MAGGRFGVVLEWEVAEVIRLILFHAEGADEEEGEDSQGDGEAADDEDGLEPGGLEVTEHARVAVKGSR